MAVADEVCDSKRNDSGFPRARSCEDQQGAVSVQNRLFLRGVQFVEEVHGGKSHYIFRGSRLAARGSRFAIRNSQFAIRDSSTGDHETADDNSHPTNSTTPKPFPIALRFSDR